MNPSIMQMHLAMVTIALVAHITGFTHVTAYCFGIAVAYGMKE